LLAETILTPLVKLSTPFCLQANNIAIVCPRGANSPKVGTGMIVSPEANALQRQGRLSGYRAPVIEKVMAVPLPGWMKCGINLNL
jgi:hypothetical protein